MFYVGGRHAAERQIIRPKGSLFGRMAASYSRYFGSLPH